jgi:hypothetical protein
MELPEDVLQLVREYAKPWFTHYKQYKRSLVERGIHEDIPLRNALQYYPEIILPVLVKLEKSRVEYLVVLHDYAGKSVNMSKQQEFYNIREICCKNDRQYTDILQMLTAMHTFKILMLEAR